MGKFIQELLAGLEVRKTAKISRFLRFSPCTAGPAAAIDDSAEIHFLQSSRQKLF